MTHICYLIYDAYMIHFSWAPSSRFLSTPHVTLFFCTNVWGVKPGPTPRNAPIALRYEGNDRSLEMYVFVYRVLDLSSPRDEPPDSEVDAMPPPFCATVSNPADPKPDKTDGQPEFRTPKEKECWALFRRMTEKGLPVSYDTVLR